MDGTAPAVADGRLTPEAARRALEKLADQERSASRTEAEGELRMIDWSKPAAVVNADLHSILPEIRLDRDMLPVEAVQRGSFVHITPLAVWFEDRLAEG